MKKQTNVIGAKFKKSVIDVANDLGILPVEVSKVDYLTSSIKGTMTEWELRKLGGFDAVKKLFFPPEKNVIVESASKMMRKHRSKLNAEYGETNFLTQEFLSELKSLLDKAPTKIHKPVKTKAKKSSKSKKTRTIIAQLSDTHYGCNIEKSEVHVNEFGWTIAARRTALFCEQIVLYKPQYRSETELVLCVNGDIIAGMIHDQEWFVDVLTLQFAGAANILTQAIGYLAQNFRSVKVVFTPGNHGRAVHKSNKDRALTTKWDSYETMLFLAIKWAVESKYSNVKTEIPTTPYAIFTAHGHHYFQTHGDTVLSVGNPGKNINIKSINEQVNKLNASEIGGKSKFAAVLIGHVHVPTVLLLDNGTELVINGCLSGLDPFALGIGIFSNNPTQVLFEATEEHPVGDIRKIKLKSADNREDLDQIIEPFKGSLE